LKNVIFFIVCYHWIFQSCSTAGEKQKNPPSNILFIVSDDHSARVMGCYGNPFVHTPHMDQLAKEGVLFSRAYANAPLCSASRQSMLTGRYPHATGVTLLTTSFPDEQVTLAEHLKEQGYVTGVFGKTHFNNQGAHGFDVMVQRKDHRDFLKQQIIPPVPEGVKVRPPWKPFADHARLWLNADQATSGLPEHLDEGHFLAIQAVSFMAENKTQPFCAWISFFEPHSPFNFPTNYAGQYASGELPFPRGTAEDEPFIPMVFKDLTDSEKRGIIASYYTSVSYLDSNIGKVLRGLDSLGLTKQTLIVYVSDHGYLLNDHNRFEKHMMWEPAVQTPCMIKGMGKPGTVINQLIELVDLVPTVLEVTRNPPLPTAQGKSLVGLVTAEKDGFSHKEYVFSEFLNDHKAMVKTEKWKYIFTNGKRDLSQGYATGNPPRGLEHRLYDQINDPEETRNVANVPGNQEILLDLQNKMLKLFYETHPKASDLPSGLSLEEQLAWFCEPPDEGSNLDTE
jgi:arylsulfatase A-like enzyme